MFGFFKPTPQVHIRHIGSNSNSEKRILIYMLQFSMDVYQI